MKNYLRTMIIILGVVVAFVVSIMLLLITGNMDIQQVIKVIDYVSQHEVVNILSIVLLGILGISSVIAIGFSGTISSDVKGGVILPLKIGDVHISTQTFESIVLNVAKKYAGLKTGKVSVKLKETGINVDLFAYVLQDTVISDITSKLQEDIKSAVLKQTTIAVETVNIKIKGVYTLNENKDAGKEE